MNLQLSWDLFIVVFFVVIVAYSLIIGRDNTIKVILGTYVALVCADAIGGLFANYFGGTMMFLQFAREAQMESVDEAVIFSKVIIFLLMVILFAVRGAFAVETSRGSGGAVGLVLHLFYAFCSAGLIISSVLMLISGVSLLGGGGVVSEALANLTKESYLALNLVYYANFFFTVPAVAFLLNSFQGDLERK